MKAMGSYRRARRAQRGQVLVLAALMSVVLFGLAAVAFDLSLAMADRRDLQAEADDAALAGAPAYATSATAAHWVAMQYLQKGLGFVLPQGSCTGSGACPAGTYTIGTYTIAIADPGSSQMDLSISHQEPSIFASLIGAGIVTTGSSARAQAPQPVLLAAGYSVAALTGDISVSGGGNHNQFVSGAVYAFGNFGGNNGPHSIPVPPAPTNFDGTSCGGTNHVDFGGASSNGLNWNWTSGSGTVNTSVAAVAPYDTSGPTAIGGTYTSAAQAKDLSGNWKPGVYSGIAPNGGKMNPGVYKIVSYAGTISPGTNLTYTSAGSEDTNGAVAIMLDNTDTGGLDLSSTVLNGLDDLHPQSYNGTRDPQGTHNFAFWSSNGATGYTGTISDGSTNVSGITYLPKAALSSSGNSSFTFTGAAYFASVSVAGGGNGTQSFQYVCSLSSVVANAGAGGSLNR